MDFQFFILDTLHCIERTLCSDISMYTLTYPRKVLDNNKKLETKQISRQVLGKTFKYSKLATNFIKYANSSKKKILSLLNFQIFEICKIVPKVAKCINLSRNIKNPSLTNLQVLEIRKIVPKVAKCADS